MSDHNSTAGDLTEMLKDLTKSNSELAEILDNNSVDKMLDNNSVDKILDNNSVNEMLDNTQNVIENIHNMIEHDDDYDNLASVDENLETERLDGQHESLYEIESFIRNSTNEEEDVDDSSSIIDIKMEVGIGDNESQHGASRDSLELDERISNDDNEINEDNGVEGKSQNSFSSENDDEEISKIAVSPKKDFNRKWRSNKRKLASSDSLNCLSREPSNEPKTESDADVDQDETPNKSTSNPTSQHSNDCPHDTALRDLKKRRRTLVNYEDLCRLDTDANDGGIENKCQGRVLTIKDMYRMPKRKKTDPSLYAVLLNIMEQNIEVSPLNKAYTGHSDIRDRDLRKKLRDEYGAKFRKHTDHEDSLILKRLGKLKRANLVDDFDMFIHTLFDFCKGERLQRKSDRQLGVRNIIGLYVGQDLPLKPAYYNYDRLITLLLDDSPRLVTLIRK